MMQEFSDMTSDVVCKGIDLDAYASSKLAANGREGNTNADVGYMIHRVERLCNLVMSSKSPAYRIAETGIAGFEVKPLALAKELLPPPDKSKDADAMAAHINIYPFVETVFGIIDKLGIKDEDFGGVKSDRDGAASARMVNLFVDNVRKELKDLGLRRRVKSLHGRSIEDYKQAAKLFLSALYGLGSVYVVRADLWCIPGSFAYGYSQLASALEAVLKYKQASWFGRVVGYCASPAYSLEFGYGLNVFLIFESAVKVRESTLCCEIAQLWNWVAGGAGVSFIDPEHPNPLIAAGFGNIETRDEFARLEALSGLAYLARKQFYLDSGHGLLVRRIARGL